MIARLSDLLRHTLEQTSEQEVSLDRELELLGRYLDIMHVRFQDRLDVIQRIDDDVRPTHGHHDGRVPRILACIGTGPTSERVVRAARRMADEANAAWVAAWVESPLTPLTK